MDEKDKPENARTGYQAAVSLWVYEGTLIWSKFAAMVSANTIVLATIGILLTSTLGFRFFRVALAVSGLILCLAWFVIIKRSFDYHDYWVSSARELEGLLEPVKTITRGASLAAGEAGFATWEGHTLKRRRGVPKIRHVSYFVILVFGIMYIISFTQ